MEDLLKNLRSLKKTDVGKVVERRVKKFSEMREKPEDAIFSELCFCILTANYNAERAIAIQEVIGEGFATFSEKKLARMLRKLGYRFPNTRARYIVEARKHIPNLKKTLAEYSDERKLRQYLVDNVKGLGYKEASHFLRNIGCKNLAICDFHIVDLLVKNKLAQKPKNMSKNKYLEFEALLYELSKKSGITQAELDLYLWYMETGKILK